MLLRHALGDKLYLQLLEFFSPQDIEELTSLIVEEGSGLKLRCQIRNRLYSLKPEEAIRQIVIHWLVNVYGYPKELIKVETPVYFGSKVGYADLVVLDKTKTPFMVGELKSFGLFKGKEQVLSYLNALGADVGFWFNGKNLEVIGRKERNRFEPLKRIPFYGEDYRKLFIQESQKKPEDNPYRLFFEYPPFASEPVEKREVDGIVIYNPLTHARPFKLLLLAMDFGKVLEKTEEEVLLELFGFGLHAGNESISEALPLIMQCKEVVYETNGKVANLKHLDILERQTKRFVLSIDKQFYELFEDSRRLYIPFLLELTGKNELALFTFLSTRGWKEEVEDGTERIQRFRISTLVEKAGINTQDHISKKAWIVSKALKNLTELGFLKSFRKEGEFFILERPSKEELRLRAVELKKQRDEKLQKLIERKKEAVRRFRQKKKDFLQEPES